MTDPRTDLEDLIEAAEKIERFTSEMDYCVFNAYLLDSSDRRAL